MERFPDLRTLAEAEVEEVLQEWKGLGYYTRARNLHRAARVVRERYQGRIPGTPEELRELPGVGEYTAGAVASISFGVTTPAVDGNVRRVLSRLFDIEKPTGGILRRYAETLVDPARPGDFNQAMMELGATICTPRQPTCADCPLETFCLAVARGTVGERPPRRESRTVPEREMGVAVCVREVGAGDATGGGFQLLLRRRPAEGLLGGMWEFPGEVLRDGEGPQDGALRCLGELGLGRDGQPEPLTPVPHAFSHLKVTYHPFLFVTESAPEGVAEGAEEDSAEAVAEGAPKAAAESSSEGTPEDEDARWIALARLDDFPLSAAQMRIAKRVKEALCL
jgi:A/G-specific adenine glycosylase